MKTVVCPYEGCGKTFSKEDEYRANCSLNMHIGRMHKKTIDPRRKKAVLAIEAAKEIIDVPTVSNGQTSKVNFCPNCGCPIGMIETAMTVASNLR